MTRKMFCVLDKKQFNNHVPFNLCKTPKQLAQFVQISEEPELKFICPWNNRKQTSAATFPFLSLHILSVREWSETNTSEQLIPNDRVLILNWENSTGGENENTLQFLIALHHCQTIAGFFGVRDDSDGMENVINLLRFSAVVFLEI